MSLSRLGLKQWNDTVLKWLIYKMHSFIKSDKCWFLSQWPLLKIPNEMRGINFRVKSQEATLADFKILLYFLDSLERKEIIT